MFKANLKHIYGPVHSWRLGVSVGVDPVSSGRKVCNLGCVYCQLGKTRHFINERKEFIPTAEVVREILNFPDFTNVDFITFSGRGEPTLAKNLGEMIEATKKIKPQKVAVITNSTLLHLEDVQRDLSLADVVVAKIDASDESTFQSVNAPCSGLFLAGIMDGLKAFRKFYKGKLALQIMFIDQNKEEASRIADVVRGLQADEIELNTPLRPSSVRFLAKNEMEEIENCFRGLPVRSVYDRQRAYVHPLDPIATRRRHGVETNVV